MKKCLSRDSSSSSPDQELLQIITGPWRAQCLYAAVKLEIADSISKGFKDDCSLSIHTGVSSDNIKRLMRLLVSCGLFDKIGDSEYSNTPTSLCMIKGQGTMRDLILFYGEEIYRCWGKLYAALLSDRSGFEIEYSMDFYSYLKMNSETADRFQRALASRRGIFETLPDLIDFNNRLVVDIGGGSGDLLRSILKSTPSAKGVLLDLESALVVARTVLGDWIHGDRISLVPSDMFAPLPANADFYVLSRVVGDLEDEKALKLLDNCKQVLKSSGRILIIEQIIEDLSPTEVSALWDLHLMMISGGRQRTMKEMERLFESSDLKLDQVFSLPLGMSLMIVG